MRALVLICVHHSPNHRADRGHAQYLPGVRPRWLHCVNDRKVWAPEDECHPHVRATDPEGPGVPAPKEDHAPRHQGRKHPGGWQGAGGDLCCASCPQFLLSTLSFEKSLVHSMSTPYFPPLLSSHPVSETLCRVACLLSMLWAPPCQKNTVGVVACCLDHCRGTVKLADFGASKKIENLATVGSGSKSIRGGQIGWLPDAWLSQNICGNLAEQAI
eukprot:1161575-Pelagomonas_calceolata.AAC.10